MKYSMQGSDVLDAWQLYSILYALSSLVSNNLCINCQEEHRMVFKSPSNMPHIEGCGVASGSEMSGGHMLLPPTPCSHWSIRIIVKFVP